MAPQKQLEVHSQQGGGAVASTAASAADAAPAESAVPKKKICCACPDTKRIRDECVAEHGPDACSKWIDAHLRCLRAEGFKV